MPRGSDWRQERPAPLSGAGRIAAVNTVTAVETAIGEELDGPLTGSDPLPAAAKRLEAWRPRQTDERQTARQAWTELDLVATTGMGTPVDRNNLNRSIRRLCAETEIVPAVTPYELRHTAITHQCEAGHHAWQIADWAGTSEKMIFLHYRHLLHEVIALPPIEIRHEPS